MRTIWKYPIDVVDKFVHTMPRGARFLALASSPQLAMWFEVESNAPSEERQFAVYGTGHEIPEGVVYLGTIFVSVFVFHVYEVVI